MSYLGFECPKSYPVIVEYSKVVANLVYIGDLPLDDSSLSLGTKMVEILGLEVRILSLDFKVGMTISQVFRVTRLY